jgi:acyl dehydratase
MVESRDFRLADEVRHIQQCAVRHDERIVTVGQLILSSTQTGDAWLLEAMDRLAAQLARDREPIHIEETDANFTIDWKGTTASRATHSSLLIARRAEPELSSDSFNTSGVAEISNMSG